MGNYFQDIERIEGISKAIEMIINNNNKSRHETINNPKYNLSHTCGLISSNVPPDYEILCAYGAIYVSLDNKVTYINQHQDLVIDIDCLVGQKLTEFDEQLKPSAVARILTKKGLNKISAISGYSFISNFDFNILIIVSHLFLIADVCIGKIKEHSELVNKSINNAADLIGILNEDFFYNLGGKTNIPPFHSQEMLQETLICRIYRILTRQNNR